MASTRPRRVARADPAERVDPPENHEWNEGIAPFDFDAERGEELSEHKHNWLRPY